MIITKRDFTPDLFSILPRIKKAKESFEKYKSTVPNREYIVLVDFNSPSYRKRLIVIDMKSGNVIREHHVGHGVKSNSSYSKAIADQFSNTIGSRKSSVGAMITGKVYVGQHGKSLRLRGLEKGVNSNVFIRAIVIHPADYMTNGFILKNNRAGNSWGCLTLDPTISSDVIDLIKDGVFVYATA